MAKDKSDNEEINRFAEIASTDDFRTYLRIAVATGEIKEEDLETMDSNDKDLVIEGFEAWVKSGKPSPKMPEVVSKQIEIIHGIYKEKSGNKEYLTYKVQGEDRKRGITYTPVYGERKDGSGPDETLLLRTEESYETPFTEKDAKALIKKARLRNPDVKLTIKRKGQLAFAVHDEENFFKPFDEIYQKGIQRELI